jgi:hypothetical protein
MYRDRKAYGIFVAFVKDETLCIKLDDKLDEATPSPPPKRPCAHTKRTHSIEYYFIIHFFIRDFL